MAFLIVFFTVIMVLDSLVLIGLVLIQLPKKDTGGGIAFGGGAADALFGAGSGNVLTKLTKYAAIIFFALAVVLSVAQSNYHNRTTTEFQRKLAQPGPIQTSPVQPTTPANTPAPATTPAPTPTPPVSSNAVTVPSAEATNTTATSATNAPAAPPTPK